MLTKQFRLLCCLCGFMTPLVSASTPIQSPPADQQVKEASTVCISMVSYRFGSLMNIQVTESRTLAKPHSWFISGEVKQKPAVTFACIVEQQDGKMTLKKLELYQVKPSLNQ